jgi:hypothetical protein
MTRGCFSDVEHPSARTTNHDCIERCTGGEAGQSADPLCMAMRSVLSLLISYCGSPYLDNRTADEPGFGVPAHVVADVEALLMRPLRWHA